MKNESCVRWKSWDCEWEPYCFLILLIARQWLCTIYPDKFSHSNANVDLWIQLSVLAQHFSHVKLLNSLLDSEFWLPASFSSHTHIHTRSIYQMIKTLLALPSFFTFELMKNFLRHKKCKKILETFFFFGASSTNFFIQTTEQLRVS